MQLREIPIGVPFVFIRGGEFNDTSTYIKIEQGCPPLECKLINISRSILGGYIVGSEEVEPVTLFPVVLESEDLKNLDHLIELEGQNEDRTSRIVRLLEGSEGAIAAELDYRSLSTHLFR